jgi:hypothetical protein
LAVLVTVIGRRFVGSGVDYYELLGVSRGASTSEIKAAYRTLAKVMHPDRGGSASTFHMLRQAYETLIDPARRTLYDRGPDPTPRSVRRRYAPPATRPARRVGQTGRLRDFGEDPDFVPPPVRIDLDTVQWWPAIDAKQRVRYVPAIGPQRRTVLFGLGGLALFVALLVLVPIRSVPVLVGLWLIAAVVAFAVFRLVRQHVLAVLVDRAFVAESGGRAVFGRPGGERDQLAERLTARLIAEYLVRMPGARVFHGLAWPDSVFADVDHAVLRGHRLVLIESKMWLPGHYTADETGALWRNGHPFRGGAVRLPEGVAAYRELLPLLEIRGALLVYPSRAGEVTTGESPDVLAPPMSAERFVREIGEWLAESPATVDRDAFRTVFDRLVSLPTNGS